MNALRLKLYQQTACYKKPYAFKVAETYPLPPHSTVKGMVHAILEAGELIPMQISIQGNYDTLVTDYQTHYFFKTEKTDEFALTVDGLGIDREFQDITTMPIYSHMLYDVNLLIHIHAEDDVLERLEQRVHEGNVHLSLGRWEDLVRVDACERVELVNTEEEIILQQNAFVPIGLLGPTEHFPYRLNWTYRIVDGVRVWDKLHVGYVQAGSSIYNEDDGLLIDKDGNGVFFAQPS
ncbi:MAG: type I-B CRISPR-associated protein Cas5b [Paenibacillus macerans]|uniref:type I-B CRISPR-associated protein Cas5b n=1 Tax=Paenibacillus TaxID=44249 RepID=UPI0022E7F96B|nr:type I-B CRISPR-associated protein Cas5b [Paenibacillus macerans]MBS5909964.1 type I-B CRISPR-associated protein Cas5 [Paenibacillus macerans]MDU7476066.1 type I-B CRISPR-associated protein Cas5b [Paenibacillus macerans]MEC0138306.1 type I-B CRISPR-associated protein Cas5b [Paenibacillus macerans]